MGLESSLMKDSNGEEIEDFYEMPNGCLCCAAKDDLFENLLQNKKAESQVELTRRSRGGVRTKHTARKSTGGKAPRKTSKNLNLLSYFC